MSACAWCEGPIPPDARVDSIFCCKRCRQTAFRLRQRRTTETRNSQPMRMGYADPPYPGMAGLYRDQPTYGGEVDHRELIASLAAAYDGWALSTSAKALRSILPMCPEQAYVAAWVKPIGAAPATYGKHNTWEPLIVVPGRCLRPGFRDWLSASPARGGGDLIGRKPIAFCAFLFEQLGLLPGDTLDDLFPGTGIVGRAWREACRAAHDDASRPGAGDPSPGDDGDVSLLQLHDA